MATSTLRNHSSTSCASGSNRSAPKVQTSECLAHTRQAGAMRLPGYLIAFILGLLLATTTPVGTGAGLHQFDLLHPLFSHVHLVNGRIVTHEQLAWESSA